MVDEASLMTLLKKYGFYPDESIQLPKWIKRAIQNAMEESEIDWLARAKESLKWHQHIGNLDSYLDDAKIAIYKAGLYQQGTTQDRVRLAVLLKWEINPCELKQGEGFREFVWRKMAKLIGEPELDMPAWFSICVVGFRSHLVVDFFDLE